MQLPHYVSIEIVEENESLVVYAHSTIHNPKKKLLSFSYALEYPVAKILSDERLVKTVGALYGFREVHKFEVA